jgi:hypothetical protein
MRFIYKNKLFISIFLLTFISSCSTTSIITKPLRLVGGVASYIPVVGGKIENTFDASSDIIEATGDIVNATGRLID